MITGKERKTVKDMNYSGINIFLNISERSLRRNIHGS